MERAPLVRMLAPMNLPCDECGSPFLASRTAMAGLCAECAHQLYGYPPCAHIFEFGACANCGWDGSTSTFIASTTGGSRVFHDAGVVDIQRAGSSVRVLVEGVWVYAGQDTCTREDGEIVVSDVSSLLQDDVEVDAPSMLPEFSDGQILTLERRTGCLWLLVEWSAYSPPRSATCVYEIYGGSVRWRVTRQYPNF